MTVCNCVSVIAVKIWTLIGCTVNTVIKLLRSHDMIPIDDFRCEHDIGG